MQNPAIEVHNLSKHYKNLLAVNKLSFSVPKATCLTLLGPNGAGKTTAMKMLYGKTIPDKNQETRIKVFGFDPRSQELNIKNLSGVIPQEDNLDAELNVIENLRIYACFYNIPKRKTSQRIYELLRFMELENKKKSKIRELSGGMKRRLLIARALLNDPILLFLDEPTTGLDPQVRQLIWDKLHNLKKDGVTILLTTHYMDEAFQLADNVIIMEKGKNVLEGPPKTLLSDNIEPHVLEVHQPKKKKLIKNLFPHTKEDVLRSEESNERLLYYSHELNMLQTITHNLKPGEYYLRQANLEDLFLKVTGRKLNELQ